MDNTDKGVLYKSKCDNCLNVNVDQIFKDTNFTTNNYSMQNIWSRNKSKIVKIHDMTSHATTARSKKYLYSKYQKFNFSM